MAWEEVALRQTNSKCFRVSGHVMCSEKNFTLQFPLILCFATKIWCLCGFPYLQRDGSHGIREDGFETEEEHRVHLRRIGAAELKWNRRDALPDSVLPRGGISLNLKYRLVLSQFFGNLTKSILFRSQSVQSHEPDKLHNLAKVSSFKLYNS